MRTRLSFLATAAALVAATPASAAITFIPGGTGPLPGEVTIATFDGGNNGPITSGVLNTDYVIQNNSDAEGAMPAAGLMGNYLSVLGGGAVTFTAPGAAWRTVSFIYGSADTYNTLQVFSGGVLVDTFTGSQIVGAGNATGNQFLPNSNGLVYLYGYAGGISGIRLSSSQNSFEIDNLRINAVPEPGTWAMMLLGFGAVGYAMRRRKPVAVPQVA